MSLTVILVIIFAVAMMVGPVFMLQPSRRQRHLADTRTSAAKLGLTVRLAKRSADKSLSKKAIAVYTAGWPVHEGKKFSPGAIVLARVDYQHELHLAEYWSLVSGNLILDSPVRPVLEKHLQTLSPSIQGVEVNAGGVGLYWSEREGEDFLPQLKTQIEALGISLMPFFFR